jgi:hypothetical protein
MAKRRTRQQIDADKIIKEYIKRVRRKGLPFKQRKQVKRYRTFARWTNYKVQPDNVLTFGQLYYGQWNYPKRNNKRRKNALLIAINDNLEDATAIIIQSITDAIIQDY